MTQIVARLVLAMLLLPATAAVFVILFLAMLRPRVPPSVAQLLLLWSIRDLFVGTYWVLLWRGAVHWTRRRVVASAGGTLVSLLGGVALAGVGLSTRLSAMRRPGLRPFLVGLVTAVVVSGTSLVLIHYLGPAGAP